MLLLCRAEFIFSVYLFLLACYGRSRIRAAGRLPIREPAVWPSVSVIVAARNEAAGIEAALASMLSLDYPNLEWIVVDDRSDDDTPRVLAAMKARHPQLEVVRVNALPKGWLGKNHALNEGVRRAKGEYLLFTDADVIYKNPSVLRPLLPQLLADKTDHATLLPRIYSRSFFCDAFISFFGMQFMIYFRPWAVPNPKSKAFVGVGAFNLVRRAALEKAGGMEAIRLRPDDDVKLGKILKRAGFRSELFTATREIECEWHTSLGSCLTGLEKSIFPGFDYKLWRVVVGFAANFLFHLLPFLLLFFAGPAEAPWAWGAVALQVITVGWIAHIRDLGAYHGFLTPLSTAFCLWALVRNTYVVYRRGGLQWRGTFYALSELEQNVV